MPYWHDLLSDGDMREVVAYIKHLSPVFDGPPPEPLVIPPRVPPDVASIARGRDLYVDGCAECHGPDGRGQATLQDAKGYPVITRDLTAPWTFRGGSTPNQLWLRRTTGLAPGPMPSFASTTTPKERWDLVNYVLSLPVSTVIVGCDSIAQLEENVRIAREFTPLSQAQMAAITKQAAPIANQALFFHSETRPREIPPTYDE